MSWECRHKSAERCNKLGVKCDPGIKGCVLRGKVYFPFAPEKNPPSMMDPDARDQSSDGGADGTLKSD